MVPLLNEFTRDGPHTGAREDISVEHTQLQLVLGLFQLADHLTDKLKVLLAVADEGIKPLWSSCIQFSLIKFNNVCLFHSSKT